MRIAVLADIHGNLPAFEAALNHVSQQKVDQIILAGDIIIGSPEFEGLLGSGFVFRLPHSARQP